MEGTDVSIVSFTLKWHYILENYYFTREIIRRSVCTL